MLPSPAPAVLVAQAVVGHVGGAQPTAVRGAEVTVFTRQIDAPLAHQRGVEGRVMVGRNVQIVGNR